MHNPTLIEENHLGMTWEITKFQITMFKKQKNISIIVPRQIWTQNISRGSISRAFNHSATQLVWNYESTLDI